MEYNMENRVRCDKGQERNSNFELLRIIAMFMIILIHANMYLPIFCPGKSRIFYNGLVNGICNIGVTCFILISGYYGVRFNIKKIVKMECMMITYSMIETLILWLIIPEQMQGAALLEQLIKSMMPFITRKYWFYSSYICLVLFAGYIQQLLDCLKKKREVMKLLILLLVLFSVFPTLFYFELIPDNGKGIGQMIIIYMIGRYIRLYQDRQLSLRAWFIFGGLWAINGISHELPIQIGGIYHHLCKDNSITNIIMAVILFYMVKEWKFHSKVINKVAGCMFAVFALNNSLVKCMMEVLNKNSISKNAGFIGLLTVVILILLICVFIGIMRGFLLNKLDEKIMAIADGLWTKVQAKFMMVEGGEYER